VHRLDLRVLGVQFLDRADAKQFAVGSQAAERYRRVKQPVDVQGEGILGRRAGKHERQMPLEQGPDIGPTRVVDRNLSGSSHCRSVRALFFAQVNEPRNITL